MWFAAETLPSGGLARGQTQPKHDYSVGGYLLMAGTAGVANLDIKIATRARICITALQNAKVSVQYRMQSFTGTGFRVCRSTRNL
jgi:hypothetical protein